MSENYNNQTDGKFDIEKESKITADIVIDALAYAGIIADKDIDRASEIVAEEILVRRSMENL